MREEDKIMAESTNSQTKVGGGLWGEVPNSMITESTFGENDAKSS